MASNNFVNTTEESVVKRVSDIELMDDTPLNELVSVEEMVTCSSEDIDHSSSYRSTDLNTSVDRYDHHIAYPITPEDSLRLGAVTSNENYESSIESGFGGKAKVSPTPSDTAEVRPKCVEAMLPKTSIERGDGVDTTTSNEENVSSIESGPGEEANVSQPPSDTAEVRPKCVEVMLPKTSIERGDGVDTTTSNEENVSSIEPGPGGEAEVSPPPSDTAEVRPKCAEAMLPKTSIERGDGVDTTTSNEENVSSIESGPGEEANASPPPADTAEVRPECVEAMLCRTFLKRGDGVDMVGKIYGRLFDEDDITASVIKYLNGDDRMIVMVDSESDNIGKIKKEIVHWDGYKIDGNILHSFCDLQSNTIYFGAKEGHTDAENSASAWLASALSKLYFKFVFDNKGRPYKEGYYGREDEWLKALEEVRKENMRGQSLPWLTNDILSQKTDWGRLCYLAALVPSIIAFHGSKVGRTKLQENYPLLFSLYCKTLEEILPVKATPTLSEDWKPIESSIVAQESTTEAIDPAEIVGHAAG